MQGSAKRFFAAGVLFTALSLGTQADAGAQFEVDWGISYDNGQFGWQQIGQYLFDNAFFDDLDVAKNFAKFDYIDDPDPYFLAPTGQNLGQIVAEVAAFSPLNTFGFYTGSGAGKALTQLFTGPDGVGDSSLFDPNTPFGFYMATPQNNTWYTDRAENTSAQSGLLKEAGGNPQLLIYALPQRTQGMEEFLIAGEDLNAASLFSSDRDYNDMWVLVSRTTVVPEPVSSALFLLGGGAMAALRMRKRKPDAGAAL